MMYLKLVQISAFQGILYLNSIIVENFNLFLRSNSEKVNINIL